MPRHDKDGIDFHHPYNSWCSKIEVEDKFFEVRFIERRSIVGVIIQRANLEEKWVTKAKIQYEDYSNNWVYARSNHLKDVSIHLFRSRLYTPWSTGMQGGKNE
jgi:hypothetical protein